MPPRPLPVRSRSRIACKSLLFAYFESQTEMIAHRMIVPAGHTFFTHCLFLVFVVVSVISNTHF